MTWDDIEALTLALPGTARGTSYGRADVKVAKKMFVCIGRTPDHVVLPVDFETREHLMESQPETFYVTDHYKGWPTVLVRLAAADRRQIAALLERAWAAKATKTLLKAREAARSGG